MLGKGKAIARFGGCSEYFMFGFMALEPKCVIDRFGSCFLRAELPLHAGLFVNKGKGGI